MKGEEGVPGMNKSIKGTEGMVGEHICHECSVEEEVGEGP